MINNVKFPFYLRRSFYIHCTLAALTLVGGKLVFLEQQNLQNKNLELVRASVRVDMVSMPQQTLEELKSLSSEKPTTSEPEPTTKKEEQPVVTKTKAEEKEIVNLDAKSEIDKHQSFLSKLKTLSGKKITKKSIHTSGTDTQQLKQLVLAGNKLSKGTESYGDSRGANQTAFQAYVSGLPQKVKPYWRLPSFLLEKKLKCRVRVWIAMNGQVTRTEIYQSSGENEFDQKAIDAVKSASPFPELSAEFGKRAIDGEILLGFPL
jgi:TonB family protein